jgi:nuclear GTP-binding protein
MNSNNPDRKVPAGADKGKQEFYRSKAKIKLLNMYNDKPDMEKMYKQSTKPTRIEPNRKWFGNVRTIS